MEISQLRCFIAVAEELHFGRAAENLNMTQPPLSRQVRALEHAMECDLFVRTSRSVHLTAAGEAFLPHARRALRLLETAQGTAREVAEGRQGILKCGFTAVTAYRFLPLVIGKMKLHLPDVSLILKEMVTGRQLRALDSGELDVGLLRPPVDQKVYQTRRAGLEALLLALPRHHPLAAKPQARWRDLAGIDLIMYDQVEAKYFHDLLSGWFTSKRVFPNYVQYLTQTHSILSLVRAGVGVGVVPRSARILDVSDVEYREFTEHNSPLAELVVAWRHDNRNPLIPAMVDIATDIEPD